MGQKIHTRFKLNMSLMDKLKFLIGWKCEVCVCAYIHIYNHEDSVGPVARLGEIQPQVEVYKDVPSSEIEARGVIEPYH